MKIKKELFGVSCVFLLLAMIFAPLTTALPTQQITHPEKELFEVDRILSQLMKKIEQEATTQEDVFRIIDEFRENNFPPNLTIIREILDRLISFLTGYFGILPGQYDGNGQSERTILNRLSDPLVLSYGAYKRFNPFKDNEVRVVKQGFTIWHYGRRANILQGRTLIVRFRPFDISRTTGPQCGIMKGFRGIYFDVESRITGMTYTFFFGRALRVRAFDLTPLR